MKFKLVAVLMAIGMFAACGWEMPSDPELVSQGRPIINGLPPDQPMHNAVVSLHQRDGDYWYPNIFCSGTLITPTVVLTAAHCLDVGRRKPVTISPDELVIYVGEGPVDDPNPEVHVVVETLIHPSYSSVSITNDIGLVRLASSASATPVPPLPAALGFTEADVGGTLNFAGFGADENNNYDIKLQLDGILGSIYSPTKIYYEQQDGGPCFGDSGGPAFIKRGNTAYVGGMTSYGDQYCAQYGISTRADAFEDFICTFAGNCDVAEPFCGDGTCDAGEDCANCADDCGACAFCGDGTCDADEDCNSCESDCGACPASFCGDGTCDLGEDCFSCPSDCPAVVHPRKGVLACCGNLTCEKREDASNCAIDCQ